MENQPPRIEYAYICTPNGKKASNRKAKQQQQQKEAKERQTEKNSNPQTNLRERRQLQ